MKKLKEFEIKVSVTDGEICGGKFSCIPCHDEWGRVNKLFK